MTISAYIDVTAIKAQYAPYHTMPEFEFGYDAYMAHNFNNPGFHGVRAQAWDRGAEAAMKVLKAQRWVEDNVGAN